MGRASNLPLRRAQPSLDHKLASPRPERVVASCPPSAPLRMMAQPSEPETVLYPLAVRIGLLAVGAILPWQVIITVARHI
ncbi:MAG: hypothetical protein OSB00_05965 [Sphingomonas bacterium]|nr:hypothetical protein [Sphingomonas bacterium]